MINYFQFVLLTKHYYNGNLLLLQLVAKIFIGHWTIIQKKKIK